jgi:hypothetical protein
MNISAFGLLYVHVTPGYPRFSIRIILYAQKPTKNAIPSDEAKSISIYYTDYGVLFG